MEISVSPSCHKQIRKEKERIHRMIKLLKRLTVMAAFAVVTCGIGPATQAAPQKIAVAINSEYSLDSYPFPGTFTMSVGGVVVAAGTVTMEVASNHNGIRFHCIYRFTPTSGPVGTFI